MLMRWKKKGAKNMCVLLVTFIGSTRGQVGGGKLPLAVISPELWGKGYQQCSRAVCNDAMLLLQCLVVHCELSLFYRPIELYLLVTGELLVIGFVTLSNPVNLIFPLTKTGLSGLLMLLERSVVVSGSHLSSSCSC